LGLGYNPEEILWSEICNNDFWRIRNSFQGGFPMLLILQCEDMDLF